MAHTKTVTLIAVLAISAGLAQAALVSYPDVAADGTDNTFIVNLDPNHHYVDPRGSTLSEKVVYYAGTVHSGEFAKSWSNQFEFALAIAGESRLQFGYDRNEDTWDKFPAPYDAVAANPSVDWQIKLYDSIWNNLAYELFVGPNATAAAEPGTPDAAGAFHTNSAAGTSTIDSLFFQWENNSNGSMTNLRSDVNWIPEPTSLALFALGGLAAIRRRNR